MVKLSVNINKIATLRNSRGGNLPDVKKVAHDCLLFGAQGITVHPRPDERHIRRQDVYDIKDMISKFNLETSEADYREFNIEGFPSENFLQLIEDVAPDQATLVPDPPEVLTSNAGWDVNQHLDFLTQVTRRIRLAGIRCSLFVDPLDLDEASLEALKLVHPDRAELYTEKLAASFSTNTQEEVFSLYRKAAQNIDRLGIGLNAGHDLNLKNIGMLRKEIPILKEVSIGHALFCEALYLGLKETIAQYLQILRGENKL